MPDMTRPLENSYWVVSGRLLAGEYPYGADDADTRLRMFRLRSAGMREIQARIRAGLYFGRNIYVHCKAGIGRTALVVGCYLAEQGLDGKAALKQVNRLWRRCARSSTWPKVPQTPEQADYIVRWPSCRTPARPARRGTR